MATPSFIADSEEVTRELFDAFVSGLPDPAWIKDDRGIYVYANRQFRDFGDCIGNNDYSLWPKEVAERMRAVDRKALSIRQPQEIVELLKQGHQRFRIRVFPLQAGSQRVYAGGIAVEQAPLFPRELVGAMECSGDKIIGANDTLLGWLGLSREDLTAGRVNWRDLTPARYRAADDAAVAQLRSTGYAKTWEKELLHRDGNLVPVLMCATGTDPFTCIVLNVSERNHLEARLLTSQKLESLGMIASGMAHDVNNMLGTIMGNASLALDAMDSEHPALRPVNEVVIASRRASDLTQQVLRHSCSANHDVRAVDLSAAVREIGSLLETTISKKITLRFELAAGLPFIDAVESELQQVIMNLVINASDAIWENPGEIVVRTGLIEGGVCFEVRDTGCGMSDEIKARVFDPFFTTKSNGRGLGLAAVERIVRRHNGALLIESEPGVGTLFRVVFPISETQPLQSRPVLARRELWGSETVLVADDDGGILRMTRAALERFGYTVLSASDGEETVKVYREHHREIAVVLLDWAMPVMNGDEALRRILAINPAARVLMSSGYAETGAVRRMESPLLAGFVQKPYTITELAARLREIIEAKTSACSRSSA
jgi:signal transduction histidine kinase/ActR/RegA family two-component response regulator